MLVIAHRGASAEAPENTLAALNRAIDCGADGIEIDVYYVDGEIFVFHDRYLERLTAQPGRLCDLSIQQIRTLKIFNQHPIPTLEEALACVQGRCLLNIELKGQIPIDRLIRVIDSACHSHNFRPEQLILSSFNHHWLAEAKQALPWLQIGALSTGCMTDYARFASDLNAYSVHSCVDFVESALVADAHQRGLPIYVYTVDEARDIESLLEMGVDGIFTNHPQHARNVINGLATDQNELLRHR